jgi:hypothetical protein
LDADVAAALERLCKTREASFKAVVNDALRCGLKQLGSQKPRKPLRTRVVSVGRPKLDTLDNIAEVLAWAEGEPHK